MRLYKCVDGVPTSLVLQETRAGELRVVSCDGGSEVSDFSYVSFLTNMRPWNVVLDLPKLFVVKGMVDEKSKKREVTKLR